MRLKIYSGLLIVALLMWALPVGAGIYKWRDDQGKLHFTDDKSKIPLKYQNPGSMERFKGAIKKSAPKKSEAPAQEVKPSAGAESPEGTAAAGAPTAGEAAEEPKKELDPKLKAMLIEAKSFFERENSRHQSLVDSVEPDEVGGKAYARAIKSFLKTREKLINDLRRFKLPSLKEAQKFLQNSVRLDKKFKMGGDDYGERVVKLKKRMVKDIETKKGLIEKFKADLGEPKESQPPQKEPNQPQADPIKGEGPGPDQKKLTPPSGPGPGPGGLK